MKNILIQTFNKFNYDYYRLNLDDSLDIIINQVEEDLILNPLYNHETSRKLIVELWQIQRKENIKQLSNNSEFNNLLSEIIKDNNYSVVDNFIICKKFISCTAIKTPSKFYVLNDNEIQKITSLGYGISQYKIEKSDKVKNIYCFGKHPNLNKETNSFCIGSELTDLSINKSNLEIIESTLSQFNLISTFISNNELSSIMEVLESEEKEKTNF